MRMAVSELQRKKMAKIFVIMGKSSTGKDTIFGRVKDVSGLKLLTMYTTRPQRSGEVEGREYFFTDEKKLEELERQGLVIEKRIYETVHGPWTYFTVDDGQIDVNGKDNYLIIATLEAYENYVKRFGRDAVVPIYIEVDDRVRIHRALAREDGQSEPRYVEMCRRFVADDTDFSEEKIAKAGISIRFVNDDLEACAKSIVDYIAKEVDNVLK